MGAESGDVRVMGTSLPSAGDQAIGSTDHAIGDSVRGRFPLREDRRMAIASVARYAEMLDAARTGGFAYPAINVTSSDTLNAALTGFADAGSDGIVQITAGGAAALSGGGPAHAVAGASALALMARPLAERVPVSVALHTDHCPPALLEGFLEPLIAASEARVRGGADPLFNSHMFDGSTLELEENLALSARLLARCRAAGIVLEIEVGVVGGEEDGVGGGSGARLYTTTGDLLRVADALGTGDRGRYLLAATFGNVHGLHPPGRVRLRPEILRDGQLALAAHHAGARFDYVFHGSSGTGEDMLRQAVEYGVVKVNLDSEAQYAYTRAVAGHMFTEYDGVLMVDGGVGRKRAYDPRNWNAKGQAVMAARVARACEQLGSAGRSLELAGAGRAS
jgi:fructose-bisphosphate aldolase, class II